MTLNQLEIVDIANLLDHTISRTIAYNCLIIVSFIYSNICSYRLINFQSSMDLSSIMLIVNLKIKYSYVLHHAIAYFDR